MDSRVPKHREISRELQADISAGKYAGGKLPSEAQLVTRFGVSRPTVARALRDLREQGLVDRRAGSGTYLRSEPAPVTARQLGLLVPERGTTEVLELICGELSGLARSRDYALLYGATGLARAEDDLSERHAWAMCEQFIEQRVAGVFFAPFEDEAARGATNRRILEALENAGIPLVLLDRDILRYPQRSRFDLVSVDNFAGGYLLAEHLIKLGCRKIGFLRRPTSGPSIPARIAGAREAMVSHEIVRPDNWVMTGDPGQAEFVREHVAGRGWDAVLCGNDATAAHLLRVLDKLGFHVPRDLRVTGFDDANFASLLSVTLTTLQQPCREIAAAAFRAMVERLAEPTLFPRSILVGGRLVVRESCGAYPASS